MGYRYQVPSKVGQINHQMLQYPDLEKERCTVYILTDTKVCNCQILSPKINQYYVMVIVLNQISSLFSLFRMYDSSYFSNCV